VNACEVAAHLIGSLANNLAPSVSGLNLVVAAVLRDSLCVLSLLPRVTDCCMLHTVCKFVLTTIKQRLLLVSVISVQFLHP